MNTILHPTIISNLQHLPLPVDDVGAIADLKKWGATSGDVRAHHIAESEEGRLILICIFGNSPYLANCVTHESSCLIDCLFDGVDTVFNRLLDALPKLVLGNTHTLDFEVFSAELRGARRRASLAIALAEIFGIWSTCQSAEAQSRFADQVVTTTVDGLLLMAANSGDICLSDISVPSQGSGLIVLGLGKLGGYELNYSSDIDLIILYEPAHLRLRDNLEEGSFFSRLAGRLVEILETRTANGYVFRTDLRLRPDPGSTPLAVSTTAAETYYESLGQNWERAALIKARPVAGDFAAANNFLEVIEPFVWRKSLDFAAIEDIHSIKRQIHAHRGGSEIAIAGHNIKLGRGGIREIEFFAQTQQLIWGGRIRQLRSRSTCEALALLECENQISRAVYDDLVTAYWFLRRIENRMQMIHDSQVHSLPRDPEELDHLARFLGYQVTSEFTDELLSNLQKVASHYSGLFDESPDLIVPNTSGGNLVFTGVDDDPETLETLRTIGYPRPELVTAAVRTWHHGRLRATRSNRSREILTQLMPVLLTSLSRTADPEAAFINFNEFLTNLPAGIQLFSLFQAHPQLLDVVAEIMGTAPRLAGYLSRQAHLLDSVLTPDFFNAPPGRNALDQSLDYELGFAKDFQDVLDITRRWSGDVKFKVSVQHLRGMINAQQASEVLSGVADILIEEVLKSVEIDFRQQYGKVAGAEFAIVAFGKLGSRMMTRGSDLDLVFIFHAPPNSESDGARSLNVNSYYSRLCQRLITALSVQTGQGQLYDVDVQLRPMGVSGSLVCDFSRLENYYQNEAWTWELMALNRARVIVAPNKLRVEIEQLIENTLCASRDAGKLASNVYGMRRKVEAEHGTENPWHIKYVRGGLVDLEFIVQYLQLRDAAIDSNILSTHTIRALESIAVAGSLPFRSVAELTVAAQLFLNLQSIMRISLSGQFEEKKALNGLRDVLVRASGAIDFPDLKARLINSQRVVSRYFAAVVRETATVYEIDHSNRKESK